MYYTLENFIDYCDEIEIAEESAQDMYDCHNKYYEKMGKIAFTILDTDDIKKAIKLCDDYLKCLKEYRSELASINYTYDESKQIKTAKLAKGAAHATSMLAGTMVGNHVGKDEKSSDGDMILSTVYTQAAVQSIGQTAIQSKFTDDIKSDYEKYIVSAEKDVTKMKRTLEDALQKGYTTITEIRHAYRIEVKNNKIIACKKLFRRLKAKK